MSWHRDREINQAIIRLVDSLCTWERNTGNGSKLLLIHDNEEDGEVLFAMDGKPVSHTPFELGLDLDLMKAQILKDPMKKEKLKPQRRYPNIRQDIFITTVFLIIFTAYYLLIPLPLFIIGLISTPVITGFGFFIVWIYEKLADQPLGVTE